MLPCSPKEDLGQKRKSADGSSSTFLPCVSKYDSFRFPNSSYYFREIASPFVRGDRTVVCKHWLRGLCKKGDDCEFLHEYDMTKMPECYFYQKFGTCLNKECPFQHIDPTSKIRDCPWYDRGFCRHGPSCRHRHTRRVLCINYLVGFCPDGKERLKITLAPGNSNWLLIVKKFCQAQPTYVLKLGQFGLVVNWVKLG